MSRSDSPILSIVEKLEGQKLNLNQEEIYSPSYWIPYLPLHINQFTRIKKNEFLFEVEDVIKLDPTGTLKTNYKANGEIIVNFIENSPTKGAKWSFSINVNEPECIVHGAIRARNIDDSLKIGIFIYQLDSSDPKFKEFGQDAIFFAIRWYLRKLLKNFNIK